MAHIDYQLEDEIGWLTINNPQKRNALTFEMQTQFAELVQTLAHAPPPLLVIHGRGDRAFASGGDLQELQQDLSPGGGQRLASIMRPALDALTTLPCPVVGAANGDAAGGGVEILTACDLRIAVPSAKFHFAQIRNGLITGWGGTGRLLHLIGQSHAAACLLAGKTLTAAEAQTIGFIHHLLPAEPPFKSAVRSWVKRLLSLPRHALHQQKKLLWLTYLHNADLYHAEEQLSFVSLYGGPDHLEALSAFQEKRKPNFKHGH
ncbi:MAG: enoyl-CoA hydratase/isomerase family protein [Ardenticatenaceae bacterium]|nr:enoyl-CoA hydratase/isomerase family protein [Ardenticatenaceae bacterium]